MQWSERPPAARPRFAWLVRFHFKQRSPSVAVAHFILVRRMKHATNRMTHWRGSHLHSAIVYIALLVISAAVCADTLDRLSDVFNYMPTPPYPIDAYWRSSNGWRPIEGTAICRVTLNADGTVARVEVAGSSGNKKLDLASVEALRQWRAKPGRPGRYYNIPIRFHGGGSTLGSDNGMGKEGLGMMKSRDR